MARAGLVLAERLENAKRYQRWHTVRRELWLRYDNELRNYGYVTIIKTQTTEERQCHLKMYDSIFLWMK